MRELLLRNLRLDLRSIGLFRILISLVLIGDWLVRWGQVEAFYTEVGVFPNALRAEMAGYSLGLLPLDWTDSVPGVKAIFLAGLACYSMLLVGFQSRVFCVLSFVFFISLGQRNPLVLIGADQVLSTMLLWAVFLPLGRRFSLDSWQARRRGLPAESPPGATPAAAGGEENTVFSIAGFAAVVQIALIYSCTAVAKSGVTWQDGTAMYYTLHMDQSNQWLALWARELPIGALKAFTWSALAWEYAAAPMILSPWGQPYLRRAIIVLLTFMHLAIALTLKAGSFSYAMMATYSLLLADQDWRMLRRWGRRAAGWLGRWFPSMKTHLDGIGATAGLSSSAAITPQDSAGQASSGSRRAGRWLANVLVIFLLIISLGTAFNANIAPRVSRYRIATPGAIDWIVAQLGIQQHWNMFAPDPPRNDGWWVIDGRTVDGDSWDPLSGAEPRFEKPPRGVPRHNVLWRSYLKRVWLLPGEAHQPRIALLRWQGGRYFAGQLMELVNNSGSGVDRLDIFYVQEFTREPGQPQPFPTQAMHLGSYDSGAGQYSPGTRSVLWTYWHADGVRAMEGEYQGDKKTGAWRQWDVTGQLREVGNFQAGLPHGEWTVCHLDGRQETGSYDQGRKHGVWTYLHANGKTAEAGPFRHDRRHGVWKRWDESGQIRQQSELVYDVPHGLSIVWGENGRKLKQGEYDQGEATGPWNYWYPNGQEIQTGSYQGGVKVGRWQSWHENGRRESTGNYISGREHGPWTYWSADGSQRQEVVYENGRLVKTEP